MPLSTVYILAVVLAGYPESPGLFPLLGTTAVSKPRRHDIMRQTDACNRQHLVTAFHLSHHAKCLSHYLSFGLLRLNFSWIQALGTTGRAQEGRVRSIFRSRVMRMCCAAVRRSQGESEAKCFFQVIAKLLARGMLLPDDRAIAISVFHACALIKAWSVWWFTTSNCFYKCMKDKCLQPFWERGRENVMIAVKTWGFCSSDWWMENLFSC